MKKIYVAAVAVAGIAAMPLLAAQGQSPGAGTKIHSVPGELILYKETNFNGEQEVIDTARGAVHTDWNIRSISLHPGDRWQICLRQRFRDPCIILDRNVPDATVVGIEGQIGSARPAPTPGG